MKYDEIPIAFRPYITALETHCGGLSKEELIDTILSFASEVAPRERASFLDRISHHSGRAIRELDSDDLISRIQGLVEDIQERRSAIEDGSYWVEYGYREEDEWDDYPDQITTDQIDTARSLFIEANSLFLDGELKAAKKAYRLLLKPFNDARLNDPLLYLRERRARLARIVYLLSAADRRLDEMIDVLNLNEGKDPLPYPDIEKNLAPRLYADIYPIEDDTQPTFDDILEAATDDLPEFDQFLQNWKIRFADTMESRSQSLYLEAVFLADGISGLAGVAKSWGGSRPRGYLSWIDRLARREDWCAVVAASREALAVIPMEGLKARCFRLFAAQRLEQAGAKLADTVIVLEASRLIFSLNPSDETLVKVVKISAERRTEILNEGIHVLTTFAGKKRLLAKAMFMAGRIEETYEMAQSCHPVGWSYSDNPAGLCFSGILSYHGRERLEQLPEICGMLRSYSARGDFEYDPSDMNRGTGPETMFGEIQKGIEAAVLSPHQHAMYLKWAQNIGTKRIDHIVSNKHRGAYRRAAQVLVALYELYLFDGDREGARQLIETYRNRYNRHRAFKGELDSVLSGNH